MNKIIDKFPILKYVFGSMFKLFVWVSGVLVVLFPILYFTKIYDKIQSLLDLKYDSPFVLVPLFGCLALALISFVIGALMYFHKYKRNKLDSIFSKRMKTILTEKKDR